MDTIKDRNGMDLREEEILEKQKRLRQGGKNTQKNYTKKVLMIQIGMMLGSLM